MSKAKMICGNINKTSTETVGDYGKSQYRIWLFITRIVCGQTKLIMRI